MGRGGGGGAVPAPSRALTPPSCSLYERWQAWERFQASLLAYAPEEAQLRAEWARLAQAATRPGTPLHQVCPVPAPYHAHHHSARLTPPALRYSCTCSRWRT